VPGAPGTGATGTPATAENPNGINNPAATNGLGLVLATQTLGMEVRDSSGQTRIGQIADLLLHPHSMGMALGANAAGTGAVRSTIPGAGNAANTTTPGITNPTGTNPTATNPTATNPTATNPTGTNPAATSPTVTNPTIAKPGVTNPATGITNPGLGTGMNQLGSLGNDIRFALLQVDNATSGRVVVIPWELLAFQGSYFILDFDQSRLSEAPSVMQNDPRLLQSDQWLNQVGTFFGNNLQPQTPAAINPSALPNSTSAGAGTSTSAGAGTRAPARTTQPATQPRK